MSIMINAENFETEVLKSDKTVILDFYADWCGPCKKMKPIVEAIAEETAGLKLGTINVDDSPELAAKFKVMSIPTLVVMKNGVETAKAVGLRSKSEILKMLG